MGSGDKFVVFKRKEKINMKLLIITQKVDLNDGLLGFMHGWIKEFANNFEKIIVVALGVGEYKLPENVKILSLGKNRSVTLKKFIYLVNFYKYIWRERKNYDSVFVHMNKEYVLLGGLFWRLTGKKIALWYNHSRGNVLSVAAGLLANIIFFTSPFSFFVRSKKARQMPGGIDTEFFKKSEKNKVKNSILFLSRISPVKKADVLLQAIKILDKKGIDFLADFVGEPGPGDKKYFQEIIKEAEELKEKRTVSFLGKAPNVQTPAIYNQHMVLVNLTDSGSFDKTILEAMACETLVLVSNRSYDKILPAELLFQEGQAEDLAEKLLKILSLPELKARALGQALRQYVLANHELEMLIKKIAFYLEAGR